LAGRGTDRSYDCSLVRISAVRLIMSIHHECFTDLHLTDLRLTSLRLADRRRILREGHDRRNIRIVGRDRVHILVRTGLKTDFTRFDRPPEKG
jgi:hypothetical protein